MALAAALAARRRRREPLAVRHGDRPRLRARGAPPPLPRRPGDPGLSGRLRDPGRRQRRPGFARAARRPDARRPPHPRAAGGLVRRPQPRRARGHRRRHRLHRRGLHARAGTGWRAVSRPCSGTPPAAWWPAAIDLLAADRARPTAAELYESVAGFRQQEYVDRWRFGATANLFTRASVFDRVGPFDERLRSLGDREWGRRVFDQGFTQRYADAARVRHPARRSVRALLRRARRMTGGYFAMRAVRHALARSPPPRRTHGPRPAPGSRRSRRPPRVAPARGRGAGDARRPPGAGPGAGAPVRRGTTAAMLTGRA